jgi:uncharacterized SAM-binding protein YcdF (DUF218 family)
MDQVQQLYNCEKFLHIEFPTQKIPEMKKRLKIFFLFFLFIQLAAEGFIFLNSAHQMKDQQFDYIFLLGIKGDLGRQHMIDSAKMAIEAARLWPSAKILITANEEYHEVSDLEKQVSAAGINPQNIIEETRSQDTWDNIGFSKILIPPKARVLIITSEFHQRRSLAIAETLGVRASIFGRDPRWYLTEPYWFIRERGANLVWLFLYFKHLIF